MQKPTKQEGESHENSKTDLALKITAAKVIHISKRPVGTVK